MPEDNRFAGLGDAVEDEEGAESSDDPQTNAGPSADSDAKEADSGESEAGSGESAVELSHDETESEQSTATDPTAFPFDEATKKTVYVRPETIDDLEDARALVDAQLRTEHDVRDLTGREFYDAAFRLAAADTDGLIDEIVSERDRDDE